MNTFNLDLNFLQLPLADPKQILKQILQKRTCLFALKLFWYDEESQLLNLKNNLCLGSYFLNVRIKQCLLNQQAEQIILLKESLKLVGPALPYQNLHISVELYQLNWDCAYFINVIFFQLSTKFDCILNES